jgi:crotonobetaine/carnitine-CoA ligase
MLHVLRAQALEFGDQPWLVFDGDTALTFVEAERLTNRVAHAIRGSIGPHRHVALYLRNQVEFMPAEMGAMASPGVAVPLNADARGPLLQSQIERAKVALIIARSDLLPWLGNLETLGDTELIVAVGEGDTPADVLGVPVRRWDDWIDGSPDTPPADLPVYDDLAVIAFTSGTTGRPKGVVHTHHYWYLFSAIITDSLERTPDDVLTSPLPLYHGGALHLIANSSLHAGCRGHLQLRFSPSHFWEDAARDGATYAFLLGPVANLIAKETPDPVPVHKVTSVYCLPSPPDRTAFEERFHTQVLRQGWAMTEVFPLPMRNEQLVDVSEDSIGVPVRWMQYGVVDEHDNMMAPGEIGELVWRSLIPYGMFSGYYDEPELTMEAFRNFWFHTGDTASYDADGWLRFRGRIKDRIRRRGEMIAAGEVEWVALRHDNVREAACYGVPAELGEEDVKLDVVLKEAMEVQDLHSWLVRNLPRYAVPRYLEVLNELPKTPSGRIEKYKLQERLLARLEVYDSGYGLRALDDRTTSK